jgi:subtilase family serine protease
MLKVLSLAAAASSAAAGMVSLPAYPNGWHQAQTHVFAGHELSFTIVVQEQGLAEIKRIAHAVSDPQSAEYGKYMSQSQIDATTAPTEADMAAVTNWLEQSGVTYTKRGVSNLVVSTTAVVAAELFNTKFHYAKNTAHGQALVRAGDYEVPAHVEGSIATIFGLHGLPLPPKQGLIIQSYEGVNPANVTPAVLAATYDIKGVTPAHATKNIQAVAEFQGQFMNSTDLATMFKNYVKTYTPGTDDVVYKWVGEHKENSGGIEAELDIQFIMGVQNGPTVKTEFWEFPGNDFGADLHQWTGNLTLGDDFPFVHSVSYGWQGNLSGIHVKQSDVDVVDANFAKCAAKGISIMISSGDSGSGYSANDQHCQADHGAKGVGIAGDVIRQINVEEVGQCCEEADQMKALGWTFVPAKKSLRRLGESKDDFEFTDAVFHDMEEGKGAFKSRDVFTLNGKLTKKGGDVKCVNANGTYPDTTITFSAPGKEQKGFPESFRNVTATFGGKDVTGRAVFIAFPGQPERCVNIEWKSQEGESIWEQGPNPPPPPPPGKCTLYKTVTSHTTANATTFSGFAVKSKVVLWPSWPASSPWVTSVGATRFVDQKAGNAEMASDQFGSGGGFSEQFDQSDAAWQVAATATYLSTVDPSTLPPADAFPAKGRGTPDVSALGEGYQVIVGGHPTSVGGTSASSPAFAGMISLINEARIVAGKPVMGFLNPFLYKNADAFTDVVLGSNKVGRGGEKLPYGWNCTKGWDPATGLGTPLFGKLLAAALK